MIMAANHFSFLLSSLLAITALAQESALYIDCGGGDYSVINGINWVGDSRYIQTGQNARVPSSSLQISYVMDTLRFFSSSTTSCYRIPANIGDTVQVTASFYYGNYDGKSSPPSFYLQFTGTDALASQLVYTDNMIAVNPYATYVLKEALVGVCLTPTLYGGFPFISALKVLNFGPDKSVSANLTDTLYYRIGRLKLPIYETKVSGITIPSLRGFFFLVLLFYIYWNQEKLKRVATNGAAGDPSRKEPNFTEKPDVDFQYNGGAI